MEFLVILFMIVAVFYVVILAPALAARKEAHDSGSSYIRPASNRATNYADRPKMTPLLGIEISASQRRRLGRDDPPSLPPDSIISKKINLPVFSRPDHSLTPLTTKRQCTVDSINSLMT